MSLYIITSAMSNARVHLQNVAYGWFVDEFIAIGVKLSKLRALSFLIDWFSNI